MYITSLIQNIKLVLLIKTDNSHTKYPEGNYGKSTKLKTKNYGIREIYYTIL